jgi:stage III sporulation protein SpoIIIAA
MRNPTDERFEVAEALLTGLFESRNPIGLIFAGPPAFGKTELVRRMCRRYGNAWRPTRPSAKGLVQHVHESNGSPVVFDDFDEVFQGIRTLGVFKVLLSCPFSRGRARFSVPRRRIVQAVG